MAKGKTGMALPKKAPMPPPHSKSVDAGYKPQYRGGKRPPEEEEVLGTMAEDRKAVYEEYNKSQGLASTPEETPETPPAVGEPEVPPVEETPETVPEIPEKPETPPEVGEEPPAKKPEEKPKTVPHEALHEEREKHKATKAERDALKSEVSDLRKQQTELLRSTQALAEKVDTLARVPAKKDEPPVPMDDPEAVIRQLQSKVAELSGKTETWEKQSAESRRAAMVQDLNTRIAKTGTELEGEGFKGFNYFLDQVTAEVRKQLKPDNSNASEVDAPENWKKVYKEVVYPRVKGMFAPEVRAQKKEEKVALKKEAGLVGSTNAGDSAPEPKKKEWTMEDAIAWQRKNRAS